MTFDETIRLECLRLAIKTCAWDADDDEIETPNGADIRGRARRFERYVLGTETEDDLVHDEVSFTF